MTTLTATYSPDGYEIRQDVPDQAFPWGLYRHGNLIRRFVDRASAATGMEAEQIKDDAAAQPGVVKLMAQPEPDALVQTSLF